MQNPPFQIPFQGMSHPPMGAMMIQPPAQMAMPQNSTLYIGNLDKTVTENLIFDRFSRYGKIIRFSIMRDKIRNESRGFAFIEFQNIKDAEAAKNQLNNEKLQTRYIRVMWKGDHKKAETNANVFVREIDPAISQNDLESFFQRFGPVLSSYLSVNEKGDSNKYGYIQYRQADDAQKCLQAASEGKLTVGENNVIVEIFKTKTEREDLRQQNMRNIYIREMPENVSEDDIRAVLKKFGKVTNMITNKSPEHHSSYALVAMEKRDEAAAVIAELNGKTDAFKNQDKPLFVTWHKNKSQLKEERRKARDVDRDLTLYMRNLKAEITKPQLEELLKSLGTTFQWMNIRPFEATEAPNSNEKYKTQYAFIKMNSKDQVQTVLGKKDSKEVQALFHKEKPFIDIAMPKQDRERMKAIQQRGRFPQQPMGMHPYLRFPQMMFPPQLPWGMQPQQMRGGAYPGQGPMAGRGGRPNQGPRRGGPGGPRNPQQGGGRPMNSMQQMDGGRPMQMGGGMGGYQQGPRHQPPMQHRPQEQKSHAQPQPEAPKKLDLATIRKNWENFKSLKPEEKRNILGEFLYPKVLKEIGNNLAPKITGMLVDFEVMTEEEIVEAIDDDSILRQRINEAKEALDEAETN